MRRGSAPPFFSVTLITMKRENFVCTIGFQGDTAIVDGTARKKYGKRSPQELLDEGLYRYAFCAALYDDALDGFVERFRAASGIEVSTVDDLKRLFGVFSVPDDLAKVQAIS